MANRARGARVSKERFRKMANRLDASLLRADLQRFEVIDGKYVMELSKESIHPRAFPQVSSWIKSSGGSVEEKGEDVDIIFPEGTRVEEYDVPAEHNIQNFISTDAIVHLPNGRNLQFHQHGTSERLWIA